MIRLALIFLLAQIGAAQAHRPDLLIDKSAQEMRVVLDGRVVTDWPVSTARAGKVIPVNEYAPSRW